LKEIFQEYGGILITITAILAVIAIIGLVVGTNGEGTVGKAFTDLVNNFVRTAAPLSTQG